MCRFTGYLRTLRQYLNTEKGSHDFWDYSRALVIMIIVMLLVCFLVKYLLGEF